MTSAILQLSCAIHPFPFKNLKIPEKTPKGEEPSNSGAMSRNFWCEIWRHNTVLWCILPWSFSWKEILVNQSVATPGIVNAKEMVFCQNNKVTSFINTIFLDLTSLSDVELYSEIIRHTRAPLHVKNLASEFFKFVMKGKMYLSVHWRYDKSDWMRRLWNFVFPANAHNRDCCFEGAILTQQ